MQKLGPFGMNGFMVFLLTCFSVGVRAQQTGYLILMDAENKQAFTIRVGDQLYVSSAHGHLVLSHLKDSLYRLNIRFPKKRTAELSFPVTVKNKDLGLQLKGVGSSWVLYNWLTKETIKPVFEVDSSRILEQGVKREDGFSRLMAAVVNDTAVMYNTYKGPGFSRDTAEMAQRSRVKDSALVIKKQMPVKDTSSRMPPKANDLGSTASGLPSTVNSQFSTFDNRDLAIKKQTLAKDTTNLAPPNSKRSLATVSVLPSLVNTSPKTITSGVKKLREVSLKISRKLVFLDMGKDGKTDTITLFVYFETADTGLRKQLVKEPLIARKAELTDTININKTSVKIKSAINMGKQGVCEQLASVEDLESARSAILIANSEKDKMAVASAAFNQKCFSVLQLRLLTSLFVSDKARYRLMETARGHIADKEHFRELADMYTDKNFQKKFLVMAEKRS